MGLPSSGVESLYRNPIDKARAATPMLPPPPRPPQPPQFTAPLSRTALTARACGHCHWYVAAIGWLSTTHPPTYPPTVPPPPPLLRSLSPRPLCCQVAKYLATHHAQDFMIWNLSERTYDYSKFHNQVGGGVGRTCHGSRPGRAMWRPCCLA